LIALPNSFQKVEYFFASSAASVSLSAGRKQPCLVSHLACHASLGL